MNSYSGNRALARFTKLLLDIMLFAGAALTVSLPWSFKLAARYYPNVENYYIFYVIIFMVSGVGAVLIVAQLRAVFKTVLADDCFVPENVKALRRMGALGLCIAAVTALRIFIVFTPAALVVIIVFFLAALFSFVLAGVFDRAVSFKQENDLTV